tara:strand:- start:8159 stop:8812 length:654 start_codon:yes stop_codon:yes gene_type:complete
MTNAFTKGAFVARRMTETSGAFDGAVMGACSGLIEGTKVATARGFQRIEAIEVGDRVVTFDHGLQEVRAVRREAMWIAEGECPRTLYPLFVPAGAIDNAQDMILLPHQAVLIESDVAEAELGDPFVLMQARDLNGICGITRVAPTEPAMVITLEFDNDEVVFANSGAMCICPSRTDLAGMLSRQPSDHEYRTIKSYSDPALVAAIRDELDGGSAQAA